jgi:hypothetical protein
MAGRAISKEVAVSILRQHVQDMPAPLAMLANKTAQLAASYYEAHPDGDLPGLKNAILPYQEITRMAQEAVDTFALEAFKALPEKDQEELAQLIAGRLRKPASIDSVTAEGAAAIKRLIGVLVDRELEASRDVLMHRIATLVAERWEAEVEALVGKRLAEAVAKIKADMAR